MNWSVVYSKAGESSRLSSHVTISPRSSPMSSGTASSSCISVLEAETAGASVSYVIYSVWLPSLYVVPSSSGQ